MSRYSREELQDMMKKEAPRSREAMVAAGVLKAEEAKEKGKLSPESSGTRELNFDEKGIEILENPEEVDEFDEPIIELTEELEND